MLQKKGEDDTIYKKECNLSRFSGKKKYYIHRRRDYIFDKKREDEPCKGTITNIYGFGVCVCVFYIYIKGERSFR